MSKISKKASSDIILFIQAINPSTPKSTSYDEAWKIISEYGGLIGSIYTYNNSKKKVTIFELFKESPESLIYKFEWDNEKVFCDGDWDWTEIFKSVLNYIIKNKIVKKPRKSSRASQKRKN